MKLKVVKNSTFIDLVVGTRFDIKRDGGFWTTQVDFNYTDKNLLKRFDRVEIYEETPLTYPIIMQIGLTDRMFTSNILTWDRTLAGIVYSYYVKINIYGSTLKIDEATVAYMVDDVPFLEETTINVKAIKKSSTTLWSGNVNVGKNYEFALTLPMTLISRWLASTIARTRIDYDANWLYNVVLVEPNKILQGQLLPNISFTQSLDNPTLTLADLVVKILKKMKPRLWQYRNQTEFTLSSAGASKLTKIAPDDMYVGKTLLDVLIRIGEQIDAFPKLINWTEIDFEYINVSTTTTSPSYSRIELSESIDDFATEIVMDAENVDLGGQVAYYPNKLLGTFVIPNDLNTTTTADNGIIELPYNIKRITKITAKKFLEHDEDFPDLIPAQEFEIEYYDGQGFVEKSVWDNLPKTTFWASTWDWFKLPTLGLKNTTCYYEYGNNKIFNVSALKNYGGGSEDVNKLAYVVEYEPLIKMQFSKENQVELDGGLEFTEYQNQGERIVEKNANYGKIKSDARNRASTSGSVTYISNTYPILRSRLVVLGDTYTVTRMVIITHFDHYEINAELSSDFNKTSQFVAVDREPRKYEVIKNQTVTRVVKLNKRYKINVSEMGQSLASPSALHLTISGMISFLYPLLKDVTSIDEYKKGSLIAMCQFNYKTALGEQEAIAMVVPTMATYYDDRISILFRTRDNANNDFFKRFNTFITLNQATTTEAIATIFTDQNGELESVDVKLIPVIGVEQIQELPGSLLAQQVQEFLRYTYPLVSENYYINGYGLGGAIFEAINYTGENAIYLDKDRREILSFQLNYDLTASDGVVIYDTYTKNTAFIGELGVGSAAQIKLLPLTGEIISCSYDACEIIDVSPTSRIRIKFTPNTGGQTRDVNAILFYVNNELVLSKSFDNTPVTSSQQTIFVTIEND